MNYAYLQTRLENINNHCNTTLPFYLKCNNFDEFLRNHKEYDHLRGFKFKNLKVVNYLCKVYDATRNPNIINQIWIDKLFASPISYLSNNYVNHETSYIEIISYYNSMISNVDSKDSTPDIIMVVQMISRSICEYLTTNYKEFSCNTLDTSSDEECSNNIIFEPSVMVFKDLDVDIVMREPSLLSMIEYSRGKYMNRGGILSFLLKRYNFYTNVRHNIFNMNDEKSLEAINNIFIIPIDIIFNLGDEMLIDDEYGKMLFHFFDLHSEYSENKMVNAADLVWDIYFEFIANREIYIKETSPEKSSYINNIEYLKKVYETIKNKNE